LETPFPVVTRDTAFRLETAELDVCLAKLRAHQKHNQNSRGVEIEHAGNTVLFSVNGLRSNPSYHRVMNFSDEDEDRLDFILGWYNSRDVVLWFDIVPALVSYKVLRELAQHELYQAFFLDVVFGVPSRMQGASSETVATQRIDLTKNPHDFAAVMSEGLGIPIELLESTKKFSQVEFSEPGWQLYLASIEGQPAAIAALYIENDVASIAVMATAPGFRNRGCQTSLLDRCIRDAVRSGCSLLLSQTEPSSVSERNMVRSGFRVAYTKAIWSQRSSTPMDFPGS
jgi:ribosomal protein S18 acetylase RimI-like enzyme